MISLQKSNALVMATVVQTCLWYQKVLAFRKGGDDFSVPGVLHGAQFLSPLHLASQNERVTFKHGGGNLKDEPSWKAHRDESLSPRDGPLLRAAQLTGLDWAGFRFLPQAHSLLPNPHGLFGKQVPNTPTPHLLHTQGQIQSMRILTWAWRAEWHVKNPPTLSNTIKDHHQPARQVPEWESPWREQTRKGPCALGLTRKQACPQTQSRELGVGNGVP